MQSYSDVYNGTEISNIVDNAGVEENRQICFEVTDSNITTPSISYHNSKAAEQTPVVVSVNSGGFVTNDITPNITPINIEEGAFVEVYTWSDDASADGLVQASELTLHGVTQFTAGVTDVLWYEILGVVIFESVTSKHICLFSSTPALSTIFEISVPLYTSE